MHRDRSANPSEHLLQERSNSNTVSKKHLATLTSSSTKGCNNVGAQLTLSHRSAHAQLISQIGLALLVTQITATTHTFRVLRRRSICLRTNTTMNTPQHVVTCRHDENTCQKAYLGSQRTRVEYCCSLSLCSEVDI